MEMLFFSFPFSFLKIILSSEGAGTATGEAKIIFRNLFYTYRNLKYYTLKPVKSFTYCKGGLKIQEDDHYER